MPQQPLLLFFFFFNDTATTEIYTLSLHDALPICRVRPLMSVAASSRPGGRKLCEARIGWHIVCVTIPVHNNNCPHRSEEHTSELQSQSNLVCRLLLEKKKNNAIVSASVTIHST